MEGLSGLALLLDRLLQILGREHLIVILVCIFGRQDVCVAQVLRQLEYECGFIVTVQVSSDALLSRQAPLTGRPRRIFSLLLGQS